MPDDLFDDWVMPTDRERDEFVVDEKHFNGMVRRYRRLRRDVAEIDAQAAVEHARITSRRIDLVAGADRDMQWIEEQLCGVQRAVLDADPAARKTLTFLAGGHVKASPTGGQPTVTDRALYAEWAVANDLVQRDGQVTVPWEVLLAAVQLLHRAVDGDIGDQMPTLIEKIAEQLDEALEAQTKFLIPSHDQKHGRIQWNEWADPDGRGAWIDRETGERIPGLGRAEPGFNVRLVVDE